MKPRLIAAAVVSALVLAPAAAAQTTTTTTTTPATTTPTTTTPATTTPATTTPTTTTPTTTSPATPGPRRVRPVLVNVAVFENGRFVVEDVITAREAGTLTSFVVRTRPFVPGCFVRISLFGNRVSQERISLFGRCGPLVAGIVRVLEGFAPVTGRDPVVFGELATPAQTTATPAN